jgi:hypothetical protein
MPVVPPDRRRVAGGPELPDVGGEANEDIDCVMKCGRCRVSFLHPSIGLGDPPKWWVCPSCRSRLLRDVSGTDSPDTDSLWARDAWRRPS